MEKHHSTGLKDTLLKEEMTLLRLRLASLEGTPVIMKLLVDLALVTKNKEKAYLDEQDFLNAIDEVNEWINDTENFLQSEVH